MVSDKFIETFNKYIVQVGIFFGGLMVVGLLTTGNINNILSLETIVPITGIVVFFALLLSFIELKYVPWRKSSVLKKVQKVFGGEIINQSYLECELEGFLVFVTYDAEVKFSKNDSYTEAIKFHIPKAIKNRSKRKRELSLGLSYVEKQRTVLMLKGSPYWLNRKRRKLAQKLIEYGNR